MKKLYLILTIFYLHLSSSDLSHIIRNTSRSTINDYGNNQSLLEKLIIGKVYFPSVVDLENQFKNIPLLKGQSNNPNRLFIANRLYQRPSFWEKNQSIIALMAGISVIAGAAVPLSQDLKEGMTGISAITGAAVLLSQALKEKKEKEEKEKEEKEESQRISCNAQSNNNNNNNNNNITNIINYNNPQPTSIPQSSIVENYNETIYKNLLNTFAEKLMDNFINAFPPNVVFGYSTDYAKRLKLLTTNINEEYTIPLDENTSCVISPANAVNLIINSDPILPHWFTSSALSLGLLSLYLSCKTGKFTTKEYIILPIFTAAMFGFSIKRLQHLQNRIKLDVFEKLYPEEQQ